MPNTDLYVWLLAEHRKTEHAQFYFKTVYKVVFSLPHLKKTKLSLYLLTLKLFVHSFNKCWLSKTPPMQPCAVQAVRTWVQSEACAGRAPAQGEAATGRRGARGQRAQEPSNRDRQDRDAGQMSRNEAVKGLIRSSTGSQSHPVSLFSLGTHQGSSPT